MSDEPPEGYGVYEIDPDTPDSLFYQFGVASILHSPNNPEATLQVALTHQDVSTIAFALILMKRLFRETAPEGTRVIEKFAELGNFQGFFTKDV